MSGQQQPNILDPTTQAAWDNWCDARIDSRIDLVHEGLEGLAEEAGTTSGQHTQKLFELLEIVQVLATGNDFLCGRVEQLTREFKRQNGIEHKEVRTVQRTIEATTTEEQHTSSITKTLAIVEEVLHGQ